MEQLNPYLTFPGTCVEAFEFYAHVFGGQVTMVELVKDSPMAAQTPAHVQDWALHARVALPAGMLMGSDDIMGMGSDVKGITLQAQYPDFETAKSTFEALSEGGEVKMAFQSTFFAAGFGQCIDKFGIPWMVNCSASKEQG